MDRREFVQNAAAIAVGRSDLPAGQPGEGNRRREKSRDALPWHRSSSSRNVERRPRQRRRAFEQAARTRPNFVLFPELFLTGGVSEMRQDEVAAAMAEIARIVPQIRRDWTGWNGLEGGRQAIFNQVRIIDTKGAPGRRLCQEVSYYGDAKKVCPGKTPLVFSVGGLTAEFLSATTFG